MNKKPVYSILLNDLLQSLVFDETLFVILSFFPSVTFESKLLQEKEKIFAPALRLFNLAVNQNCAIVREDTNRGIKTVA
jgi:hypothetical protein